MVKKKMHNFLKSLKSIATCALYHLHRLLMGSEQGTILPLSAACGKLRDFAHAKLNFVISGKAIHESYQFPLRCRSIARKSVLGYSHRSLSHFQLYTPTEVSYIADEVF